jgi:hypothetical protein
MPEFGCACAAGVDLPGGGLELEGAFGDCAKAPDTNSALIAAPISNL